MYSETLIKRRFNFAVDDVVSVVCFAIPKAALWSV
jgi:hypothetical protein